MSWKFDNLRFGVETFIGDRVPARIMSFVYKVSFVEFPLELCMSGVKNGKVKQAKCRTHPNVLYCATMHRI